MKKITIEITDDQAEFLEQAAIDDGSSVDHLVRVAVENMIIASEDEVPPFDDFLKRVDGEVDDDARVPLLWSRSKRG